MSMIRQPVSVRLVHHGPMRRWLIPALAGLLAVSGCTTTERMAVTSASPSPSDRGTLWLVDECETLIQDRTPTPIVKWADLSVTGPDDGTWALQVRAIQDSAEQHGWACADNPDDGSDPIVARAD